MQFLRRYYDDEIGSLAQRYPREQQSLRIDWTDLYQYDHAFAERLLEEPNTALQNIEQALGNYDLPIDVELDAATVRVFNLPDEFGPAEVSRDYNVGRLVEVNGQVQKVTDVKPMCEEAAFRCVRCQTLTRVPQDGNEFQEPHECRSCERQGPFRLSKEQSEFTNHQTARVQQPPGQTDGGNAASIDVHLEGDITNTFSAGDRVTVGGILDLDTSDDDSPVFDTELLGKSVTKEESDYEDIDVDEHLDEIRAIAAGEYGDPYELIQQSIKPTHIGDEEIKLALGLQMFGGWQREYPNGQIERGDSHIILLGDPGCGKSSLLEAVAELAPRSVYTSGKGASAAGLTAAAVRDDFGEGEWTLEAGALVLSDGGVACVDEIDKMDDDAVSSMHEALEAQRVNINKAGINATLNAQSSLLAAGNPKYGRFQARQPIGEQIDLDPALISRFDLIFMVSDQRDEEEDREVLDGMIESRSTGGKYTLGEELDEEERESIQPKIDHDVLRAYIAYARENVFPLIRSDEVKQRLKDYFVDLRSANKSAAGDDNPVPVTFRKEQAIERLAEASARIRLSDEVEMEDVERAVHLVEKSLRQVGRDPESGQFDADIIETGVSHSQRNRKMKVLDAVKQMDGASLDDLDEELEDLGRGVIESELDYWATKKGDIYDRGDGVYLSTDLS